MKKILLIIILLWSARYVWSGNTTQAGEFRIEPPTLHCLGFEWFIDGDDNRNGKVEVSYRQKGQKDWQQALPLLRLQHEIAGTKRFDCGNLYAGSIFGLEPGIEYEVRFVLTDPDGGNAEKTVTTNTRRVPKPFAGGRKLHLYPADFKGKKEESSFTGFRDAYAQVQPGDTILVHAGKYMIPNDKKLPPPGEKDKAGFYFIGYRDYLLDKNGTEEKPITIMAVGDGAAIFDGQKAQTLFHVLGDYHYLIGLTLQGQEGPNQYDGGLIYVDPKGCKGLAVLNCNLYDAWYGIWATTAPNRGFVITDNRIIGINDWRESLFRSKQNTHGIWISGQGHSIGYNYVANWYDGIDHGTNTKIDEKDPATWPVAIDIYNNEITGCCDDFLETDFARCNIRVLRNRCTNAGTCGLSAQPVYGGPVYFIRNTVFNVTFGCALKFEVVPAGLVVYNNTIAAPTIDGQYWCNGHFRNNLFLGAFKSGTWTPNRSTMDYNGYLANPKWHPVGPKKDNADDIYIIKFFLGEEQPSKTLPEGKGKGLSFRTLEEFTKATGYEQHGILIKCEMLRNVPETLWCRDAALPIEELKYYEPSAQDFRLVPGTPPVDAGCILPNVTDGFTGKAPDLGALELDAPIPQYGPRSK